MNAIHPAARAGPANNPNRAYPVSTPPPPCAQHSAWGDRFSLNQSGTVQTSETAAMRCTDSSTGHFFYMSPGSYQIG
jgi:hypothetical protein